MNYHLIIIKVFEFLSNNITFIIGSLSGGGSEGVCVNVQTD